MVYRNKYGQQQQQELKQQQTAYQAKLTRDLFRSVIKWLEKYVETAYSDNYPDWQSRKQTRADEIRRTDIAGNPEKVEKFLATALYGFEGDTDNPELLNELKEQYYKWIDVMGININNCPERLKHFLVGFHEILEGNGEKINRDAINRTFEVDPSSQEYADNFANSFIGVQIHLQNERKIEESLAGKSWKEMESENKFEGNAERGKIIFEQIVKNHDYRDFHFWPQKRQQVRNPNYNPLTDDLSEEFLSSSSPVGSSSTVRSTNPQHRTNSEIIQDIRQSSRNWRIDEIIVGFDDFGRTKRENVLIHQSARLDDYNQQTGELNFEGNAIYRANRFSAEEQTQINQALNVSQSSTQVKQPPYNWSWN